MANEIECDPIPESDAPQLIAARIGRSLPMRIVRAPVKRAWIDGTNERFAAQCLPLMMASQAGWFVLNSHPFRATWNGDRALDAVRLEFLGGEPPYPAGSHFGEGILTFHIPYLFRTPPGWNLLARGPANMPKPGISPLEGLIETDWAVASFTMNWQMTAIEEPVTFEVDEPVCMIVPQRRFELESFQPILTDLSNRPKDQAGYNAWSASRSKFNEELRTPGSLAAQEKRQRHYIRGRAPDGTVAPEHQTNLKLRDFYDPEGICPPPDSELETDDSDFAGFTRA